MIKRLVILRILFPTRLLCKERKKMIREILEESRDKKTVAMFTIRLKGTQKIIGCLDIFDINRLDKQAKIGYWLGRNFWGKGYALEAARDAIRFAFEKLYLRKLFADTLTDNLSSNRLLIKAGFRRIGVMKKDKLVRGKLRDRYLWELIKKV
jgi:[ribosomal protein S5]-alanine N-acetyltransferase